MQKYRLSELLDGTLEETFEKLEVCAPFEEQFYERFNPNDSTRHFVENLPDLANGWPYHWTGLANQLAIKMEYRVAQPVHWKIKRLAWMTAFRWHHLRGCFTYDETREAWGYVTTHKSIGRSDASIMAMQILNLDHDTVVMSTYEYRRVYVMATLLQERVGGYTLGQAIDVAAQLARLAEEEVGFEAGMPDFLKTASHILLSAEKLEAR